MQKGEIAVAVLCLVLLCSFTVKKPPDEKSQIHQKILTYIAKHADEELDHAGLLKYLNLSQSQLFQHLIELEEDRKIVTVQKCLRKPVLISDDDYTNWFWKVYIPSDQHPRSELGTLCHEGQRRPQPGALPPENFADIKYR